MLSEVARYYGGAFPIPDLMTLTFRGLLFWYHIMQREIIEENIRYDYQTKNKPVPIGQTLRRLVDKKLKELKECGN
ncbi:hypothetical protein LCGC14_2589830 [marine sediment metagenome]|uniref:Uncharacterized protein n=1 Tax=marine sediment metagenome TaxID=412755 RepID=A0A0F9CN14_9ZZZZ